MVDTRIELFREKMQSLLLMERDAEVEETADLLSAYSFKELEKLNLALTKLWIKSVSTGVYGRTLLKLTRTPHSDSNKATTEKDGCFSKTRSTFGPGDIVGLYQAGGSNVAEAEGLIYRVSEDEITITFNLSYRFFKRSEIT